MTSNTLPVYRHGRKFYVSAEEYERLRSEERRQRRIAAQRSQHIPFSRSYQTPTRSASRIYAPIQRSQSNPSDYRYGVLHKPHLPANSLINTTHQYSSNRSSRSILRNSDTKNDLSSILSRTKLSNFRSNSSDKLINIRRTPISFDDEHDQQHSSLPPSRQKSPISSRRSDYGIAPVTAFSMTPNDQSHIQTSSSPLTNYFARTQQSSLNPPSTSFPSTLSGTGSYFESGIQGSDHAFTTFGSSAGRQSKTDYYHQDSASNNSFSDDNSSSLLTLMQRRNTETVRPRQSEYVTEFDDDPNQQRDSWTRSTFRSQSSDGLTEKKRVRFADMEGLTLETSPNRNQLKSPVINRLLPRRQHVKVSSYSRAQPPFYQTMTNLVESRLATDV